MREKSIFYNLTDENENATTELLCNLCHFDEYKEIIFDTLGLKDFSIIFEDIITQKQISKGKKPDVEIKNDNVRVFIENKIKKGYNLLKSQTKVYPEELNKAPQKNKKMIYLVPENHFCVEMIKKLQKKYGFIELIYWEELINALEEYNEKKRSEIITESINYFTKVLEMIPKTKFSEEDISLMKDIEKLCEVNKTMAKTAELFFNVAEKLRKDLKIKSFHYEPNLVCEKDAFGYYFNKANCFLGYSFVLFDNEKLEGRDFVLSLALNKDSVNSKKIGDFHDQTFYNDGWYYFKIGQYIYDSDVLYKRCKEIMEEWL